MVKFCYVYFNTIFFLNFKSMCGMWAVKWFTPSAVFNLPPAIVSSLQRRVQNSIVSIGVMAVPTTVKPEETIFPFNPVTSDISTHKHSSTER